MAPSMNDPKTAAKERVRAKVAAAKALPAEEQIANTLHATHTAGEAARLLAEVQAGALRDAATEIDLSAAEMERVLGRRLETSSIERGVANRLRVMADRIQGGAANA